MIHTVYIGIGSNLGDRIENILTALEQLKKKSGIELIQVSPIYESDAIGEDGSSSDKPPYLNGVAYIKTDLSPGTLLFLLQGIEIILGRPAIRRINEPRTIDLDILFYDNILLNTPELTIPHPRISKRMFVLAPMSDIAPSLIDPTAHLTISEMKVRLGKEGGSVERYLNV